MVILVAGTVRRVVMHIRLVLWGCHEADYVTINQVALLGNASHYMAVARRPLHWAPRQAGSKIPNLRSWEVQLFLLQIPSRSHILSGVWQWGKPAKRAADQDSVLGGRHRFGSELEVSPRQALRSSCMSWGCFIQKHMGLEEAVLSLLGELQHKALEQ